MTTDESNKKASGNPIRRSRPFQLGRVRASAWDLAWRRSAGRWREFARSAARATGWRIWNPGLYGERWHARFRRRYEPTRRPIVIFGLNPGPYGMGQTGIPFTDIRRLVSALPALAEELRQAGERVEIPGLAPVGLRPYLTRVFESSSVRVYRFLERGWRDAERGWREVVVANPCPLLFIDPKEKKNRTPADLGRAARKRSPVDPRIADLLAECDRLRRTGAVDALDALRPRAAVLLGKDVQALLGERLARILGRRAVIDWEHPARAIPEAWTSGLLATLRRREVLRDEN